MAAMRRVVLMAVTITTSRAVPMAVTIITSQPLLRLPTTISQLLLLPIMAVETAKVVTRVEAEVLAAMQGEINRAVMRVVTSPPAITAAISRLATQAVGTNRLATQAMGTSPPAIRAAETSQPATLVVGTSLLATLAEVAKAAMREVVKVPLVAQAAAKARLNPKVEEDSRAKLVAAAAVTPVAAAATLEADQLRLEYLSRLRLPQQTIREIPWSKPLPRSNLQQIRAQ